ncbi:MAG: mechanosensitive ion channel [Bacteroidaceae bacterium]|nr:mechanosensitive ion channel [Bacteroidaceae bacterium]
METINNELIGWLQQMGVAENYALWIQRVLVVLAILLIVYLFDKVCRSLIIPTIRKVTAKTQVTWDDYLLNDHVLDNACHLIPPIVFYVLIPFAFPSNDSELLAFILKLCSIYITIVVMRFVCAVITSFYTISSEHEKLKDHSLKGFYQMLKLVVICIGAIVIISTLLDKSPLAILTGLGAGAAILMLVFQDTIKGLVAGVQLTANDMLRPGDWITMPKYGADGDVIEVTLTTVKVRNWDKTIVTVPPYALVNDSFQNWRGMFDIGGRRVKRSINIDMNSVRFCTEEELDHFKQQPWMQGFEVTGKEEVNLYIFRHYMDYYLHHHPKVNQEMIMTVRQLQPTAQGMPIELYFFSANTAWLRYEHLQAEVFDHLLAVLQRFGLKVFQSPTGLDLQKLTEK